MLLPEAFIELLTFSHQMGMDLSGSPLTLDSAFDSKANHQLIKEQGLIPVIYPNKRNTKEPIAIACKFRWFRKDVCKERYKVERTFGWRGTYRRLVLSYDTLKETRLGFHNLAYAMINFRATFNET